MSTFIHQETFTVLHCSECGVAFGITANFMNRRKDDRKSFCCPGGHSQWFPGETASDRAQRLAGQLDMERTRRAEIERRLDYQARARKAASTRLRKVKQRVGKGVCPCCNRTIEQLARHMTSKHPGYGVMPGDEEERS